MCRSKTSGKPILTICPMSRATSSTRSVIMTKSLCPRISLACCASCTRMKLSYPKLKLPGKEHSHGTPWAQRTVNPKCSPLNIALLDFLYGEWGEDYLCIPKILYLIILAELCHKISLRRNLWKKVILVTYLITE